MPTPTTDQGIPIPDGPDTADAPVGFTNNTATIESRLVLRYASIADRTARHPVGIEGELSHLADVNRIEVYDGANWISAYARSSFVMVRKTSNQLVNNSTTLVNVTELLATLPTAGTFGFEFLIFSDSSTTADIKYAVTAPAGTTGTYGITGMATTGASGVGDGVFTATTTFGTAIAAGGNGVGNGVIASIRGDITMGGTAGDLQLQFAQNTLDATNTTVRARSRLMVWRFV